MDPRKPSELDSTGTLPIQGEGVPASSEPVSGEDSPAWLAEARDGLTVPGKYLVFEDAGSRQVMRWVALGLVAVVLATSFTTENAEARRRHRDPPRRRTHS